MLLWTEILRSIPLPTVSLFPENKDIANGSGLTNIVLVVNFDIMAYTAHQGETTKPGTDVVMLLSRKQEV